MIDNILVILLMSLVVLFLAERLGKLMLQYKTDYQPLASLFSSEGSVGFNAVYRIVLTPICIVFFSILLYITGLSEYVSNIYLVAVGYFFLSLVLIYSLNRFTLLSKSKFFLYHLISILLSYYIYDALIVKGLEHLLPDEANLRTDLWLVVAAFLYGVFRSIPENQEKFDRRKRRYIDQQTKIYHQKYATSLDEYPVIIQNVLLAIMIYEDYNRPHSIRLVEKLLRSKTHTIMQVKGAKTDAESIKMAASILKSLPKDTKPYAPGAYEFNKPIYDALSKYNPEDPHYSGRVFEIYSRIDGRERV